MSVETASNSTETSDCRNFGANNISLAETRHYPPTLLDYLAQKPALRPFYNLFPSIENYGEQAKLKQGTYSSETRKALVSVLEKQYQSLPFNTNTSANIGSLALANTFTVTTGHQLNILSGPLYVILKLQTAINLAKALKNRYPEYNFVPVYWMATEDHDFEEINHFNLFGKRFTWETPQSGAVGRFNTESLPAFLETIPDLPEAFLDAYKHGKTLAEATASFCHHLFGEQGLLILNPDEPELKACFNTTLTDELLNGTANKITTITSDNLQKAGYKPQIHVRDINLFYLAEGMRERIVIENGVWKVLNTDIIFTQAELLAELANHPECFSPNVVLRPLYQETILPNLGYIGGPAEIAYWFQLMPLFQHYKLPFPILQPRLFAAIINKTQQARMEKFNLSFTDLAQDDAVLKQMVLSNNMTNEINTLYEEQTLAGIFNSLAGKAAEVDKTLTDFVFAEQTKAEKMLESVVKRIKKAEEKKYETVVNQSLALKQKLFPEQGLQERYDNFLSFYINNPSLLACLSKLNALDFTFNIIQEKAN